MSNSTPEKLVLSAHFDEINKKILALSSLPVIEHVAAYEELHGDLQKALSEIEGL